MIEIYEWAMSSPKARVMHMVRMGETDSWCKRRHYLFTPIRLLQGEALNRVETQVKACAECQAFFDADDGR